MGENVEQNKRSQLSRTSSPHFVVDFDSDRKTKLTEMVGEVSANMKGDTNNGSGRVSASSSPIHQLLEVRNSKLGHLSSMGSSLSSEHSESEPDPTGNVLVGTSYNDESQNASSSSPTRSTPTMTGTPSAGCIGGNVGMSDEELYEDEMEDSMMVEFPDLSKTRHLMCSTAGLPPRTIPFRSASFSQVDITSDGKYIRNPKSPITLKPTAFCLLNQKQGPSNSYSTSGPTATNAGLSNSDPLFVDESAALIADKQVEEGVPREQAEGERLAEQQQSVEYPETKQFSEPVPHTSHHRQRSQKRRRKDGVSSPPRQSEGVLDLNAIRPQQNTPSNSPAESNPNLSFENNENFNPGDAILSRNSILYSLIKNSKESDARAMDDHGVCNTNQEECSEGKEDKNEATVDSSDRSRPHTAVSFTLGGDDEPLQLPEPRMRHRSGKNFELELEVEAKQTEVVAKSSKPKGNHDFDNKQTVSGEVLDGSATDSDGGKEPITQAKPESSSPSSNRPSDRMNQCMRSEQANKSSLFRQSSGQSDGSSDEPAPPASDQSCSPCPGSQDQLLMDEIVTATTPSSSSESESSKAKLPVKETMSSPLFDQSNSRPISSSVFDHHNLFTRRDIFRAQSVIDSPLMDNSIGNTRSLPRGRYYKRPLRGPYGQMLEAEMNKLILRQSRDPETTNIAEFCRESKSSSPVRTTESPSLPSHPASIPTTHPINLGNKSYSPNGSENNTPSVDTKAISAVTSSSTSSLLTSNPLLMSSMDDLNLTKSAKHSFNPRSRKISANIPVQAHFPETGLPLAFHQRTASSPSQLLSSIPSKPEVLSHGHMTKILDASPRGHVLAEIVETEKSYVDSLRILVKKYMEPLKASDFIDANLVDEIFFQIPAILWHHERLLDALQRRVIDDKQCVGDVLLDAFRQDSLLECYSLFVNNWKNAKGSLKMAVASKPSLTRFLDANARQHKGKLNLDSLLIMPIQRIPRFELLVKELLKYTEAVHEDYSRLMSVLDKIKKFALHIDCASVDPNDNREIEIEGWGSGLGHLVRQDIVTISSSNVRKERAIFLFADSLVVASIKRKGARKPSSNSSYQYGSTWDGCKFKLLMKIMLSDIHILNEDTPQGNGSSSIPLSQEEDDMKTIQRMMELAMSLKCPHGALDEVLKDLASPLKHNCDSSGDPLELEIKSSDSSDCPDVLKIYFGSMEKKAGWTESLQDTIGKFLRYGFGKMPQIQFLQALPIRKTRAGLQLSCAAPVALHNKITKTLEMSDVWVANSDGYVGQICILTLQPEPAITSCNGVCNSRITCIVSVPPQSYVQHYHHFYHVGAISPGTSGTSTSAGAIGGVPAVHSLSSLSSHGQASHSHHLHHHHLHNHEDHSTSPHHLHHVHSMGYESEDETHKLRTTLLPTQKPNEHFSVWLGTEDGGLHVYDCSDSVRVKKNRHKVQHKSPLLCIAYYDWKVFVALGNGDVAVYSRNPNGKGWLVNDPQWVTIGSSMTPVTKMTVVGANLWCACGSQIKVYSESGGLLELLQNVQVTTDGSQMAKGIAAMAASEEHVWVSIQGTSLLKCFSQVTYEVVAEANVAQEVAKILAGCDDIIRQHKSACLRVTALLVSPDKTLWVGTSAGVLLTVNLTDTEEKVKVVALNHGHTGQVRFLTCCVQRDHCTVISGGDGYEEFRPAPPPINNNSNSFASMVTSFMGDSSVDMSGREDSTNHLLIWKSPKSAA